jgi:hypothetical protein
MACADHARSYHKVVALPPQLSTMNFELKKLQKKEETEETYTSLKSALRR